MNLNAKALETQEIETLSTYKYIMVSTIAKVRILSMHSLELLNRFKVVLLYKSKEVCKLENRILKGAIFFSAKLLAY